MAIIEIAMFFHRYSLVNQSPMHNAFKKKKTILSTWLLRNDAARVRITIQYSEEWPEGLPRDFFLILRIFERN